MSDKIFLYYRNHPFHLVSNNFYPMIISLTVFLLLFNLVLLFHGSIYDLKVMLEGVIAFLVFALVFSIFG